MNSTQQAASESEERGRLLGRYRWTILTAIFAATTINYMDRQIIGLLAPLLQHEIGWTEMEYSSIVASFTGAYALGLVFMGRIVDRIGTRIGYSLSITVWSIAAMAHALARTVFGFGVARALLGLGESGSFPCSIKATSEWFPKRERALANGVFNSGTSFGALVTPLIVPWIALTWGWQSAFLLVGMLGFIWLVVWLRLYHLPDAHPKVSPEELAYIHSDVPDPSVEDLTWRNILGYRQTWAFVCAKFLTDPIWWFYLYWLPKFLNERYGLDLAHLGMPVVAVNLMTVVGSVGGGWLSGAFIKRGWSIDRGRKIVMLMSAVAALPVMFAPAVSVWSAVLLIGLGTAAHQAWSANLFTSVSDMFPRRAVGSVVGVGGMAGSIGGMLIAAAVGYILQTTGSYVGVFLLAGASYLVALGIFTAFVPDIDAASIE